MNRTTKLLGGAAALALGVALATTALRAQDEPKPDADSPKRQDIRKLLKLTHGSELGMQMVGQMMATYRKTLPRVPEEFWKKLEDEIKPEEFADIAVDAYDKNLTHDDVKELIKFYESPIGQKLVSVQPQIMKDSMAAGEKLGQRFAKRVVKRLADEGYIDPPEVALKHTHEVAAIGALKTICTSESIFREGDKDENGVLDYGSLSALAKAKLIDGVLGSGTKQGYLFTAQASPTTSEFLWYATAFPETKESGTRYFFTNQAGVIFYAKAPFTVNKETCEVPPGLVPVGR